MTKLRKKLAFVTAAFALAMFPALSFAAAPAGLHPAAAPDVTVVGADDASDSKDLTTKWDGKHVTDTSKIFTESSLPAWEKRAADLTKKYGISVNIVTTSQFDFMEPREWTIEFADDNDIGVGKDRSVVIMSINPVDRDLSIVSHGKGEAAFTNYGIDQMLADVKKPLGDDDWDQGVEVFLSDAADYLEQWQAGTPYSENHKRPLKMTAESTILGGGAAVALGAVSGFGVMGKLKKKHNTAVKQRGASYYVVPGTNQITETNDVFVRSYTTQVKIADTSNDSTEGSSFSSGGWSGGSTKF